MSKSMQNVLAIAAIVILGVMANGRLETETEAATKGEAWYKQSTYRDQMDNIKREFAGAGYDDHHSAYKSALTKRDNLCKKIEQDLRAEGEKAKVQSCNWWIYHENDGAGKTNGIETPDPIVKIYD